MKYKWLIALVLVMIFASPVFSQEKKVAAICGVVKDGRSKLPLNEAVVTVSSSVFEGQKFALTDSTGTYTIKDLPPGNYKISSEMEGYEKFTKEDIILKEGASLGVSFEMIKQRKKSSEKKIIAGGR